MKKNIGFLTNMALIMSGGINPTDVRNNLRPQVSRPIATNPC